MLVGYYSSYVLCQGVGVIKPVYNSFKALQTKGSDAEKLKWLTYWMVFAIFSSLEFALDLFGKWVPFYYEAKLGFLLWLQLEQTNGATKLYTLYIEPALKERSDMIDAKAAAVVKGFNEMKIDDVKEFVEWASAKGQEKFNQAQVKKSNTPQTPNKAEPPQKASSEAEVSSSEQSEPPDEPAMVVEPAKAIADEMKKDI